MVGMTAATTDWMTAGMMAATTAATIVNDGGDAGGNSGGDSGGDGNDGGGDRDRVDGDGVKKIEKSKLGSIDAKSVVISGNAKLFWIFTEISRFF